MGGVRGSVGRESARSITVGSIDLVAAKVTPIDDGERSRARQVGSSVHTSEADLDEIEQLARPIESR
jgi:hypothetical protein